MRGVPRIRIAWRDVPPGDRSRERRREIAWDLVRELAGIEVVLSNPCPRCGGPHGSVRVAGAPLRASVSYAVTTSGTVAVAGVVDRADAAAWGIDAEAEDRAVGDALGRPASAREWVRIEAAAKADGRGLRVDPRAVSISRHVFEETDEVEEGTGCSAPRFGGSPRFSTAERADVTWLARLPGVVDPLYGVDLRGPAGILISAAWAPAAGEAAPGRATP